MSHETEVHWRYQFRVNGPANGWRERLGNMLRAWADRLDRRFSLAVYVRSAPRLSSAELGDCVRQSNKLLDRCLKEQVRFKSVDLAMTASNPELFEQE